MAARTRFFRNVEEGLKHKAQTLQDVNTRLQTSSQAMDFVHERQTVVRFVQDAIAASADMQKLNADNVGRGNTNEFKIGSLVLLSTENLPTHAVSSFGASKLAPPFIGPFTVTERHGSAYTLELPSDMRLYPTFYVGRLKPYVQPESSSRDDSPTTTRSASSASPQAFHLLPEKANLFRHLNTDPRRSSASSAIVSTQRSQKPEPSQEPPRGRGAPEARGHPGVDHMRSVQHCRQKHNSVRGTIHREVDRIVDHTSPKVNRGPVRFRIRWRQSGLLRDTWFHRNVLMTDVPEMVKAYEAHHGLEA
ncbi:hypothetical protein PHMEG_00016945 [Phytophthora megakarya]|uniref:Chromo domain-containing protein n=1 Tax=Phytophthora megakarya TaxID=4795 RepID=A0A225VZL2_9STRA|nr:hypothetical protein PHMEG_00016945 [Phytophthora megakarya]